jgi:hypothetical protein
MLQLGNDSRRPTLLWLASRSRSPLLLLELFSRRQVLLRRVTFALYWLVMMVSKPEMYSF